MKKFELSFVCEEFQIKETILKRWIDCKLVQPLDKSGPTFDEEDISRIKLIDELQAIYDVNDDALEIILHLLDQIHLLRSELKNTKLPE
jgi:chaperone modulatory protein CbpM